MSRNLRNFIAGALGTLALQITFFARHPEAITHHAEQFGAVGLAVAASALVLLAALSGLLALAVRPAHAFGALLFGVVPPALLLAAGLPRYGADAETPRKADSVWLALSPVRHVADGVSAGVRAREAEVVSAAVERERRAALTARRTAVRAAVEDVIADSREMHAAELQRVRSQANGERQAAVAEVRTHAEDRVAALNANLERERAAARAAVEARDRAETQQAALRERVATLAKEQTSVTALRQQLAAAAERREEIVREREDYRQLVAWYQQDVPAEGDTPLRVLSRRLGSTQAEDRVVAARLLVLCGRAARPILERARADRHPAVREAVETTLVNLDR